MTEGCAACSARPDHFESQLAFLAKIGSFQGCRLTRQQIVAANIQLTDVCIRHADLTIGRADAWERFEFAILAYSRSLPLNTPDGRDTAHETIDARWSLLEHLGQLHQTLTTNRKDALGFRSKPDKSDRARQAELGNVDSQIAFSARAIARLTAIIEALRSRLDARS